MRLNIVTAFILHLSSAFGQINYSNSYYPFIYKAESAIVENDLSSALSIYRSTFQSVDRVFATDLVNATVCAIKIDSVSTAIDLLHKLILKGVSEEYLNEFEGFEEFRESSEWKTLLDNYNDLRSSVQFNDRLLVQLDSISEMDQKFRIAPGSYSKYRDTIEKIDLSNIIFIREVIQQYGFPNEHILGVNRPQIGFPSEIVLHHHCQSMSLDTSGTKYNFEPEFYNAVQNGELDPHRMAQLVAMQGKYATELGQNTIMHLSLNGAKSVPLMQKVDPNKKAIIDENRLLAGLEHQSNFYHKAIFALNDPTAKYYELKRYTQSETFNVDELTYNILIQAMEPINIR